VDAAAGVELGPSGRATLSVRIFDHGPSSGTGADRGDPDPDGAAATSTEDAEDGVGRDDVPTVFLEISARAAARARPVMAVLSLPIQLVRWAATPTPTAALPGAGSWERVGALSCRLSTVPGLDNGEPLHVVVAESPGHLGIGGKVADVASIPSARILYKKS
jgi:hypothetical protein